MTGLGFAVALLVVGMAVEAGFFDDLLKADRDRHARNATTMAAIQRPGC